MDDATLVRNTKNRLNKKKTLKDWTVKAVLSNLDAYTQEEGANYLKTKLSPELREHVLQELLRSRKKCYNMEEFNRMKRLVFVLMNTRTYKIDLDVIMSYYPEGFLYRNSKMDFIEVLRMVSIAAPNVRHLKMDSRHISICLDYNDIRKACFEFLSSLKELRILELVGYVNNPMDLVLWCRNLPNLRVLSGAIILEDTNMTEEDIRLSFGHLRLLHICFSSSKEMKKICEVLPNLDIIGETILPNGLTLEDFLEDENIPRERKYLNIDEHLSESNVRADYSSIRYLEISCHGKSWDELKKTLKLPNTLDGLILTVLDSQETVEAVLLEYGANLRWLSLKGKNGCQSVDLSRISELCSKLEVLFMTLLQVTRNSTQEIKFCHLKELDIKEGKMINGSLTALLSSCLNLRKLKLRVEYGDLGDPDLQQVKNLVSEKKILGSLQSLHWNISWMTSGIVFKQIAAIMRNATANLPDIRTIKFNMENIKLNIDSIRSGMFGWPKKTVLNHAICNDKNLFEILNLYE